MQGKNKIRKMGSIKDEQNQNVLTTILQLFATD